MTEKQVQRRLAAIFAADVVGYSRLMGRDDERTLANLTSHHSEMILPCISEHRGRIVKTTGDGLLAEFASIVDAVRCAIAMQQSSRRPAAGERLEIRAGLNVGEALLDESDYFGTPVVVTRHSGIPDMVRQNQDALFVPPQAPEAPGPPLSCPPCAARRRRPAGAEAEGRRWDPPPPAG